ncbi:CMRF35-like molecule 8 isoform X4 [Xiphophorus hellerii]|uniref:CMRF35-like molecule 8 isoform X4 n=1 Tax=Xiphophorus hellerii TaxID=8084 RepID=UPI0013B3C9ED|nr:CMRF35-like molecule 8 isoform X4 [Xiphophorus hellerii]
MKVCLTLICLLFLTALQDGDAQRRFRGKEGENITVGCKFYFSGNETFFCKGICEGTNILVQTSSDTAQKGRYSTSFKTFNTRTYVLDVSIKELKGSDAGRYRCGVDNPGVRFDEFDLIVTKATTSEPNWTLKTFPSTLVTSPSVTTAETMNKGLQLYLILSLVAKIILLSTPLMISCWKRRTMKSKGEKTNDEFSVNQTFHFSDLNVFQILLGRLGTQIKYLQFIPELK